MRTRCYLFLALLLPAAAWAQNPWKDVYSENAWKDRDSWQKPDTIIALLGLQNNSNVADIGSHEGYFTVKLAAEVPNGKVYAVDISSDKLSLLTKITVQRGFHNVEAVLATPDNPSLPAGSIDAVLIVDTYHEIKGYEAFLANLKRALKPKATVVICEPIAEERMGLSRGEQFRKHEIESHYVLDDLRRAGFTIVLHSEKFVDRTLEKGDIMWLVVARSGN